MDRVEKNIRYRQIREIMAVGTPMSAKEIAVQMCRRGYTPTDERNFSSPRITELEKRGEIVTVGRKKCKYTGKTVNVYQLV